MSRFDLQLQFLLDLDLDPQPLAIEAVLVAQLVAGHGEVALVGVLVRPAPGVMDAHRVVGGDGPVEERPLWSTGAGPQALEGTNALPRTQNGPLLSRKIDLSVYLSNGMCNNLTGQSQSQYSISRYCSALDHGSDKGNKMSWMIAWVARPESVKGVH